MRRFLSILLFLWCAAGYAQEQQTARFTIPQLIAPSDQQAMGLQKLSENERLAFESWIHSWTLQTVHYVLGASCRCKPQQCVNGLYEQVKSGYIPSQQGYYQTQGQQYRRDPRRRREEELYPQIEHIWHGGAVIQLDDGTNWEVVEYDRYKAARWNRFDQVQTTSSRGLGRLSLYNINREESVMVSQPGQPQDETIDPFGKRYYLDQKLATIQQILDNGATIVLDNGAAFAIAVGDRKRYTRNWRPGTIVQIDYVGGLDPFAMRNLENGDQVHARLKRGR